MELLPCLPPNMTLLKKPNPVYGQSFPLSIMDGFFFQDHFFFDVESLFLLQCSQFQSCGFEYPCFPLPQKAVSQCDKTNFLDRGRGGRVEKISSGNLYPFGIRRPKHMKAFDFPQGTISHTLRHPHSKALEPDCLCPGLAITTQPPRGEGNRGILWPK